MDNLANQEQALEDRGEDEPQEKFRSFVEEAKEIVSLVASLNASKEGASKSCSRLIEIVSTNTCCCIQ